MAQTETDRRSPGPELADPAPDSHAYPQDSALFSRVDLVLVPVTVSDSRDRPILGLEKENFQIFDNKELQPIEHFSGEDIPVSIVVVLDTSGSMGASNKLQRAREAIVEFLKTSNPQDEVSLITVADKPRLRVGFTDSIGTIEDAIIASEARGRTALLDGIYLAIDQFKNAKYSRRALFIISDGGDNNSRYNAREITNLIKESDLTIYTIGVYDKFFPSDQDWANIIYNVPFRTEEEVLGPFLLAKVSEITGGRSFTLDNRDDMAEVATTISQELRNQYLLGYHPQKLSHDGKWHNIKVKVLTPKGFSHLRVAAKKGYYATAQ